MDGFWELVERSADETTDRHQRAEWLESTLAMMPIDEIADFQVCLDRCRRRLDTYQMWRAADLMIGGASSDSFWYFTVWVIGLGRRWFEHVAADPENLADVPIIVGMAGQRWQDWGNELWPEWEALGYVARLAYERITGEDELFTLLADRGHISSEDPSPSGSRSAFDQDPKALYPRLSRMFSPENRHVGRIPPGILDEYRRASGSWNNDDDEPG